jgi:DNA-binding response OmpR family regulator
MSVPFALFWIYFVLNLSKRQSEKLALAERRKAFLDKIAHDLRTPLANLKLYCELVAQESLGNPQAEDHCAILSAEVDRLDQVAANAMAFGRSEPPQLRDAVPDDLVQLSLERFNLRFASCKTICTIAASETQPLVFDLSAFERILVNLLDNACKYAPGAIAVATRYEAGFLRLEVSDKGPGVTPAAAAKPSGSGLGLSIVRDLAEANDGEVILVNGQPGLRVIVTLKANHLEEQLGVADGERALKAFREKKPALCLLDVLMPGIDGLSLCREIRSLDAHIPILLLSARDAEIDRVLGLEIGADDYIVKPFGPRELVARVKVALRRGGKVVAAPDEPDDPFIMGDLRVDVAALRAFRDRHVIDLTRREAALLKILFERRGRPVSRNDLLDLAWGDNFMPDSRALDQYISMLRRKIERDPATPEIIKTVHGVGYRYDAQS